MSDQFPRTSGTSPPIKNIKGAMKHRNLQPLSPSKKIDSAFGLLDRVSHSAPSTNTSVSLDAVLPDQSFNLDGLQMLKLQRLLRKRHEIQLKEDPTKRPNQEPNKTKKLTAMETMFREQFHRFRIETAQYLPVNYYATTGNEYKLRLELASGVFDINSRDPATGRTALICAVTAGQMHIVRMLLGEYRADPNKASLLGSCKPLHFAIDGGYRQIASVLLTFGADVNALNKQNCTPLHFARTLVLIKLLLKSKANPLIRNAEGLTALGYYRHEVFPNVSDREVEVEDALANAEDAALTKQFRADEKSGLILRHQSNLEITPISQKPKK